jgi:SAM-dependent methyltransferase
MSLLYTRLAGIYHDMYQHIFDYDKEFLFYHSFLEQHVCRKILEIGCGSGLLASRFIRAGYDYTGLDIAAEMLDIARNLNNQECFILGDMRNLSFADRFDAILITGRSIAYVISNQGILATLSGIYRALKNDGEFIFGGFEADSIFSDFGTTSQTIEHNNRKIQRFNKLSRNLQSGWTYDWEAKYIIEEEGKISEFEEITTLRAFTRDEITLFLKLSGFKIIEFIPEKKSFTIVAQKV